LTLAISVFRVALAFTCNSGIALIGEVNTVVTTFVAAESSREISGNKLRHFT
jgi:hypothetical protein